MNLPNKLVLDVTEDDIKTGDRLSPWDCPLAKAANRALPDGMFVSVAHTVRVREGTLAEHHSYLPPAIASYKLSKVAADFMVRFDLCEPVKPRRFVLMRIDK